jgi:microcystin-dependent protein
MPSHSHSGPSHTHGINDPTHTHSSVGNGASIVYTATSTIGLTTSYNNAATFEAMGTNAASTGISTQADGTEATGSTGSGSANMPPYLGVAYYIRAL